MKAFPGGGGSTESIRTQWLQTEKLRPSGGAGKHHRSRAVVVWHICHPVPADDRCPEATLAWQTLLGEISEVICILQTPHLPGSGTRARIHALVISCPVEKLRQDSQRAPPRSSVSPRSRYSEIRGKERVALSLGTREQTPWVLPLPHVSWQPGFSELMGQESNGC